MKASEIIKTVMKEKGYSYMTIAKKLGYSTASAISEKVRNPNGIRSDILVQILDAMDCEIVVRDRVGTKKKWELTNEAKSDGETK